MARDDMSVDPSIARKKELVQQDKANAGTQEMREDAMPKSSVLTEAERKHLDLNHNVNARLANPLEGISHERLRVMVLASPRSWSPRAH